MPVVIAGPSVTDDPPPELRDQLHAMGAALDVELPPKQLDRNLLIATWNLREFGRVTRKWLSDPGDSPKRDLFSIRAIAEVVSRFDVVALQEVQEDIEALRELMHALGPDWGLILTDAVKSKAGDRERLAFVFDTRRAKPSGLACELVVPDEVLAQGVGPDALTEQFAKTPYAVAFNSEHNTFILVTVHIKYGSKDHPEARLPELKALARWMREWATSTSDELNQNLMVLGDHNIDRRGDANYQAFVGEGLHVPDELMGLPRVLPSKSDKDQFYDQIAWFADEHGPKLTLDYTGRAGSFAWERFVFVGMERTALSFHVSDHYPLWCEFALPRR